MKKCVVGIFFAVVLCLAMVPISALAVEKTAIRTVDDLLQFAKAVDNGEYDDKTDAVVSLEEDLDLTGVAWKPIGSVFDGDGTMNRIRTEYDHLVGISVPLLKIFCCEYYIILFIGCKDPIYSFFNFFRRRILHKCKNSGAQCKALLLRTTHSFDIIIIDRRSFYENQKQK
jgi:HAMP domain-containing protein